MFLKAKAFLEDASSNNATVLIRAESQIPQEFVKLYKKNVVAFTPKKSSALRRSLVALAAGNSANISWRSRYAAAQNRGYHTVGQKRVVNIDGKFVTLMPGVYRYKKYTTAGTGPGFANKAYQKTQREMPAVMRELGLTK